METARVVSSPGRRARAIRHDPPPLRPDATSAPSWGHWIVLALILAGIAAALLVQRELVLTPASAAAAQPAASVPASPVLARLWGQPATVEAQPGTVSLTFGGGSGRDLTPQIVSALRRLEIPATFFVQGDEVTAQRGVLRRELTARDDIGMVGYTGADLARVSSWRLTAELGETQHRLLSAGSPGTALVRPPGATTVSALTAGARAAALRLEKLGYIVVLADRSTQGATSPTAALRATVPPGRAAPDQPGLVLSLPDTGRTGTAALAALPRLASDLRSAGYRFTTITTAFHLTVTPGHQSALSALGGDALLLAVRGSGLLSTILGWAFFIAADLIISRLALLILTGAWHKFRTRRQTRPWHGPVSIVIPAFNERAGIERCLRSMLDCDYPRLEIILVDDGSTDHTAEVVRALNLPVTVVSQPNAGKAAALNAGVLCARHDVLIFADGDTVFEPTTIARLVAPLRDPGVGAVAGNVKVANRRRLLGLVQHAEYVVASSLDRRMYDVLNCMVTIPGAVGAFRRTALSDVRGIPTNTLAEDTDLTIAIGLAGWRVRYAEHARAWTEAPSTMRQLWRQRHRWNYGTFQALWKHRRVVITPGSRRALAWVGLPYLFVMGCVLPLISPAADLYVLVNIWTAPWHALTLWATFLITQGTLSACAFVLDRERLRYLWTLPFQQVFYRQFMYLVVIHSMATALTGVRLRWHKLARIGVEVRHI